MVPPLGNRGLGGGHMNQRNTASNNKKHRKKYSLSIPWKGAGKHLVHHFLLSSFYYLEGKEFGSLGANLFFWPMWDGGYLLPLLTRKRRLQAWRSFGTFWGGWRSIDSPGPALEERKLGDGALKKVLRHLQCASFRHRQGRAQAIRALQSTPCTSTFTHQLGTSSRHCRAWHGMAWGVFVALPNLSLLLITAETTQDSCILLGAGNEILEFCLLVNLSALV
ncbi:hypothetical protein DER46DRAFT_378147 [Fusarium sp. MPI-SDFR-AT-0072]|nr:hypothetical protein DER46DRAFT_378147 [Fusarium sp. MPI-SDFR-AT-0072]